MHVEQDHIATVLWKPCTVCPKHQLFMMMHFWDNPVGFFFNDLLTLRGIWDTCMGQVHLMCQFIWKIWLLPDLKDMFFTGTVTAYEPEKITWYHLKIHHRTCIPADSAVVTVRISISSSTVWHIKVHVIIKPKLDMYGILLWHLLMDTRLITGDKKCN